MKKNIDIILFLFIVLLFFVLMIYIAQGKEIQDEEAYPVLPPRYVEKEHRNAIYDELFKQLDQAQDSKSATLIADKIRRGWYNEGNVTSKILVDRGAQLLQEQNFHDALKLYNTVIDTEPGYLEAYNRRADTKVRMAFLPTPHAYSFLQQAIDDLSIIIKTEPRHFDALVTLAGCYLRFDLEERALKVLKRVIEIYPLNIKAREEASKLEEKLSKESI